MRISTKGRYALRVMIDLAGHQSEDYIPLKDIANRQEISEKYLESIIKQLVKNNMLVGLRGKGGGYRLTRDPSRYTVLEILESTEESLAPVVCLDDQPNLCKRAGECQTLQMWNNLNNLIRDYFKGITVKDLCDDRNNGDDYVI